MNCVILEMSNMIQMLLKLHLKPTLHNINKNTKIYVNNVKFVFPLLRMTLYSK